MINGLHDRADVMCALMERAATGGRSECWPWQGPVTSKGYPRSTVGGRLVRVHRLSFETFVRSLALGEHVHHACERKTCINPAHLEAITPGAHATLSNGWRDGRCANGHLLTEENVGWHGDRRFCRPCRRVRERTAS